MQPGWRARRLESMHPEPGCADQSGNLYVADQDNNRVLEFDAPRNNGPPAHLVFGQPDSRSKHAGGCAGGITNADGLCFPQGIALDASDSLYVADTGNNRVLEYLNPLAPGAGTREHQARRAIPPLIWCSVKTATSRPRPATPAGQARTACRSRRASRWTRRQPLHRGYRQQPGARI